ncbi:M20 family peptidase [Clostridium estertheticum]|uniref:M20 family peptidase n=1 Tax=Clostridium estertheticum TaxID=238834 RepID=UPI001C0E1BD5|nr:M20 family peptidase [Clostridium estertheticum]MBU3174250.1 M20 family peptidase [Clostridium estertheticum]
MKQEIISYIDSIKDDIYNLSNYLYNNPETNYKEYKGSAYIINMLKTHGFNVKENYCNIPTAFYAQFGIGHPKICYICKYTATEKSGHVFGNNVNASISVASALGLSKVVSKSSGSVIVLGCPGEYYNGAELTIMKEKCFEDIDIIIAPHCDITNAESGTSMAILPIKLKYNSNNNNSSLESYLFVFNSLNHLLKGLTTNCFIDNISINNVSPSNNSFLQSEAKFYIKATTINEAEIFKKKIIELIHSLSQIMSIPEDISLFELPSQELLTNKSLSRLLAHNLKESGIINIACCKNSSYGLGIGAISHITPCIYPSISITENKLINCPSPSFALETQTEFCKNNTIKAANALAITGLDIIEKQDLLREITIELK